MYKIDNFRAHCLGSFTVDLDEIQHVATNSRFVEALAKLMLYKRYSMERASLT